MEKYKAICEDPDLEQGDDPAWSSWCVKQGELYVCTVHANGDRPRTPQKTAELIARLLNEHPHD